MKTKSWLLATLIALATAGPTSAAILSLVPSANPVLAGNSLTVEVRIDAVTDLVSWQADFSFDSAILQFTGWTNGNLLNLDQTLTPTVDNVAGLVSGLGVFSGLLLGGDGPALLATLNFTAASAGETGLATTGLIFLDSTLADISVSADPLTLRVEAPAPTVIPEPSSFWLLGVMAVGLVYGRRRRPAAGTAP